MKSVKIGCQTLSYRSDDDKAELDDGQRKFLVFNREHAKKAIEWLTEFVDYEAPWKPKAGELYRTDDNVETYMRLNYSHPKYVKQSGYGWTCVAVEGYRKGEILWTGNYVHVTPAKENK